VTWSRGLALGALLLAALNTLKVVVVDDSTIYLVLIAMASIALPEISKLSFGKDGFSFERFETIKKDLDALKAGTAAVMEGQVGGRGAVPTPSAGDAPASIAADQATSASTVIAADQATSASTVDADDPQAGQWGRQPEAAGRHVYAKVTPSALREDWFDVTITVESTDRKRPLQGTVLFHLHPTFRTPRLRPVIDGKATLRLVAWGAFTVGVQADGGSTQLELDLARVPDAPAGFRQR
jgi:hypothetical protein